MTRKLFFALCAVCLLISFFALAQEDIAYDALLAEYEDRTESQNVTAFLEISGMDLLLPVMQHPEDNGFYLTHNMSGEESDSGLLFTESTYNQADFSDPVTVIYGRRMADGSMFGSLQEKYSSAFDEMRLLKLHLPDGTREYTVVAAVPFSNIHIMHSYNFRLDRMYEAFFDEVYATRRPGAQLDHELRPASGDQVLILSTGLRGDVTQRYLVIAKVNRTETN